MFFKKNKVSVESVNKFFDEKLVKFFKKKKPKSDSYPFQIVDPYTVFGDKGDFLGFYLVGDNWLEGKDKPIVICWGFNDWKMGFVSEYLRDYRVAFAPRKMWGSNAVYQYFKINSKVSSFVVWGMNESAWVRVISKIYSIPIWRMEDGFIRSATLGASHSVPYSLVLDRSGGLYYDCRRASDLEGIISGYDFESDKTLVSEAKELIGLINDLCVTKYNQPQECLERSPSRIKYKKRIAILGQVDSDASIRFGNPEGWNTEALIKLAVYENPEAEILYRPHPEVYFGYQKSKFKNKSVEYISKVVPPSISIDNFLSGVDHVYTITSLTGFEALLRGIKVTTVGAPFYSGWGLTDDRCRIERRERKLNLESVFAAAYILYPRYISNQSNSVLGLKSSIYKIIADRDIAFYDYIKSSFSKELCKSDFNSPEYTVQAYFKLPRDYVNDNIGLFDFSHFFSFFPGKLCHYIVASMLIGNATSDEVRNKLLVKLREFLDLEYYIKIIGVLGKYYPGIYLYNNYSWACSQLELYEKSISILDEATSLCYSVINDQDQEECEKKINIDDSRFVVREQFNRSLESKKYHVALDLAVELNLLGSDAHPILLKCIELAQLSFDFTSAYGMATAASVIDLRAQNKKAITHRFENAAIEGGSLNDLLVLALTDQTLKPERVVANLSILKNRFSEYNENEFFELFKSVSRMDSNLTCQKVICYLELGEIDKALKTIERIVELGDHSEKVYLTYSKVLDAHGRYEDALNVISASVARNATPANIREKIRLLYIMGRFEEALSLLDYAKSHFCEISSTVALTALQGLGRIKEAYDCYLNIKLRDDMILYYPDSYLREVNDDLSGKLLLIAVYGPGDEIRFASIYRDVVERFSDCIIKITCDVRLFSLFKRSFPGIEFVPVKRVRTYSVENNYMDYNLIPSSDLCSILDNNSIETVNGSDRIALVSDFISYFRTDYDSFNKGRSYLVSDQNKKDEIRSRLPEKTFLVGICWRSSLQNINRNIHYLTIEQIAPIFSIEGITYINLQYDKCDEELAWVESKWPGKIINLDDIDQYNDFDSVAALMSCMDLVIAPATSVVELAGALGVPSWLFSNSSEIDWRKNNFTGKDVWHGSMEVVDCESVGNKTELVNRMKSKLERAVSEFKLNG